MKIIVYGLGKEGTLVRSALKKNHQIVGFTDSYAHINNWGGVRYIRRKELPTIEFDYVCIALSSRFASEQVKEELIEKYLIDNSRVIDFFEIFTEQKVDKIFAANKEKCKGLILGISHALCGINPKFLNGKWYNLAMGSEDIYYHYKVLKKCIDNYPQIIQDMKYVILELYDYTIFIYDVSLTGMIMKYWGNGGIIEDEHHYQLNKNFVGDVKGEMKKHGYYTPIKDEKLKKIRSELFDEKVVFRELDDLFVKREFGVLGYRDYPLTSQIDMSIEENPYLPSNLYSVRIARHEDTIQENIVLFHKMIDILKDINPDMKIILLLMPRYKILENYHRLLLSTYKIEFEQIVKTAEDNRSVFYWNFKNMKNISENPHFYMDPAHLNYSGAVAFTSILNQYLENL